MAPFHQQPRCSRLTLILLLTIVVILCAYVGSYCWLRQRGISEAKAVEAEGFLYVGFNQVAASHDLTQHHWLTLFYDPVNLLDQWIFRGPAPIRGILWDIE